MRRILGRLILPVVCLTLPSAGAATVQRPALSAGVRDYVSVDTVAVALTGVDLVDGTGGPVQHDQTIVIREGRIVAVGSSASVRPPAGALVLDLRGHTVIPGIVGMHDHLFYTAAGGRRVQMNYTGPRLYLGSGVTTIRTTGSNAGYADINLKASIDDGTIPGPTIVVTAPYITGGGGAAGHMASVETPEAARRFVAYWAGEGATWIKAYTNITRENLKAAIDEAHAHGLRATGHLCSVSFREAVGLGIDNLEHGLLTDTDFIPDKEPDVCPRNAMVTIGRTVDLTGPEVRTTIQTMIDHQVSMTSTMAVYEPFAPNRPTKDPRTLSAMAPAVREDYLRQREQIDTNPNPVFTADMLLKSLHFDKLFYDAGGLLGAGVDPTGIGGALAGYGDQPKNELFIEGGFTPVQAIQVMTLNGAKILRADSAIGSVEPGKWADLVVLRGDLTADPSVIRAVTTVFKHGVGYDADKLIASVQGRVGVN